jgi:hypothetical protein
VGDIMKINNFLLLGLSFAVTGCVSTFTNLSPSETESGYTYIPVDPFSVRVRPGKNCLPAKEPESEEEYLRQLSEINYSPILESFPDNAVRMSIEQFDSSGAVTYGPAGIGLKDESYRVTVDYVNSDTTNFSVWILKVRLTWKQIR